MLSLYTYVLRTSYFGINIDSQAATKKWRAVVGPHHPLSPTVSILYNYSTVASPGNDIGNVHRADSDVTSSTRTGVRVYHSRQVGHVCSFLSLPPQST